GRHDRGSDCRGGRTLRRRLRGFGCLLRLSGSCGFRLNRLRGPGALGGGRRGRQLGQQIFHASLGSRGRFRPAVGERLDQGTGKIQALEQKVRKGSVVRALAVADARQGGLQVMRQLLQQVEPDEPRRSLQRVDRAKQVVQRLAVRGVFLQGEQAFLPLAQLVSRFFTEDGQVLCLDFHPTSPFPRVPRAQVSLSRPSAMEMPTSWSVSFSSTAMLISMGPYWVIRPSTRAALGTR